MVVRWHPAVSARLFHELNDGCYFKYCRYVGRISKRKQLCGKVQEDAYCWSLVKLYFKGERQESSSCGRSPSLPSPRFSSQSSHGREPSACASSNSCILIQSCTSLQQSYDRVPWRSTSPQRRPGRYHVSLEVPTSFYKGMWIHTLSNWTRLQVPYNM